MKEYRLERTLKIVIMFAAFCFLVCGSENCHHFMMNRFHYVADEYISNKRSQAQTSD